ncbi:MAG: hypothetical protein CM15mP120_13310 [Pseudomonadota bacterium]|nr:MAG: hypothetical protein CM15mP120_13310 [Pseudomonadota bacterium]
MRYLHREKQYAPEQHTIAFAKPFAGQLAYDQEVANLSGRITTAFGIRPTVAENSPIGWLRPPNGRAFRQTSGQPGFNREFISQKRSLTSGRGRAGSGASGLLGGFLRARSLDDPEQNVYCGAQVLGHLLERCTGDMICALVHTMLGRTPPEAVLLRGTWQKLICIWNV